MTYPQYGKDLQHIHESEVYGRAVFDMAAKLTMNEDRKQKWLALRALEEKTLRLKDHASDADKSFFSYVYAHEKAIEAFAKKELSKDKNSLKAVNELLGR